MFESRILTNFDNSRFIVEVKKETLWSKIYRVFCNVPPILKWTEHSGHSNLLFAENEVKYLISKYEFLKKHNCEFIEYNHTKID